jgi:anti-sigma factor RsiW
MEMNCQRARQAIGPDPGPRGADAEIDAALSHYGECDACQAFYAAHRALASRLAQLRNTHHAPDSLRAKVREAIAAEPAALPVRRRGWVGQAMAVAAVAALLAIWIGTRTPSNGTAAAFVEMSLQAAVTEQVMASDVASQLQDWFASNGHSFDIPDIPEARVTRGRVTTLNGMVAAAVHYDLDGTELTYFMIPSEEILNNHATQDGIASLSSDGYQVALWREGQTSRALVAPITPSRIRAIAAHCRNKSLL